MDGHVLLPDPPFGSQISAQKGLGFWCFFGGHNFHNLRGFRWLLCYIDLYSECRHYIAGVSAIRCVGFVLLMKVGEHLNKVSFMLTVDNLNQQL